MKQTKPRSTSLCFPPQGRCRRRSPITAGSGRPGRRRRSQKTCLALLRRLVSFDSFFLAPTGRPRLRFAAVISAPRRRRSPPSEQVLPGDLLIPQAASSATSRRGSARVMLRKPVPPSAALQRSSTLPPSGCAASLWSPGVTTRCFPSSLPSPSQTLACSHIAMLVNLQLLADEMHYLLFVRNFSGVVTR